MKQKIKDMGVQELQELFKFFLEENLKQHQLRFYTGKVIDNNDPDKEGRCKIDVYGVFDDVPEDDLPWAIPDFQFIGSEMGSFVVPPNGAIVKVYFEDGDHYRPIYTTKVINLNNLPSDKDIDYPDTMVFFETDLGEFFKINRNADRYESTYRHASGIEISINKDGDMTITGTDRGTLGITMKGDIDITSNDGSITLDAPKGNVKMGGCTAAMSINNLPVCLVTGAPHSIGQQTQGTPGSAQVRP